MGLKKPLTEEFRVEQAYWYGKLANEGFIDVEHSEEYLKRCSNTFRGLTEVPSHQEPLKDMQSSFPTAMFQEEQELMDNPEFKKVSESVTRHKNNKLKAELIFFLWNGHVNGISNRGLAKTLSVNEKAIRNYIKKIKSWMGIV